MPHINLSDKIVFMWIVHVIVHCVYTALTILLYVCAFKGFGWSYPLLESVGIERPSSFRSVTVIVAVGLFACGLCRYRAKQPIGYLTALGPTNQIISP